MKQYIGLTSHVGPYNKLTDIDILHTNNVKIYLVPNNIICPVEEVDVSLLPLVYDKYMEEPVETSYNTDNYINTTKGDNFRLFVNNEVVHSSTYLQKYIIEFDGLYSLKSNEFVDH